MKAIKTLMLGSLLSACTAGDNLVPQTAIDHENPTAGGGKVAAPDVQMPATCAEIAAADPTASDGEYTLYVGGDPQKPWIAYCADMMLISGPVEYLPLVHVLGGYNASTYPATALSPGTDVTTSYLRVRIDPVTLAVDIGDQRFAISTGSLMHSGRTQVTSMPFGVAMACDMTTEGHANVDLYGTEFAVATTFVGFGSPGNTSISPDSKLIELVGGGYCGWNAPANTPFNPFNATHAWTLQLQYQP